MRKSILMQERILDLVRAKPGISAPEVAEKIEMSRVSAYQYLKSLIQSGQVRTDGKGKATRYFPHESVYIGTSGKRFDSDGVRRLKQEILFALQEVYGETESEENLNATFDRYCMYIAPDDTIITGFDAFLMWCTNQKHDFSDKIVAKTLEYLEIIASIEVRRKKNGFLDGGGPARTNLEGIMDVGFDNFLFMMPSVLENAFGRTRTAIELYYGKLNGNEYLLESAIDGGTDLIKTYVRKESVDAYVLTPPTQGRNIQFRDVLDRMLDLRLPKIKAEKVSSLGRILRPQKEIQGSDKRKERVENARISLEVAIPKELNVYKHILILDDSFTTGATPNAIALKFREAGYKGKITVITICGSFNYELAITEDEI